MNEVYILSAVRTAVGHFDGQLIKKHTGLSTRQYCYQRISQQSER
jgi:hypothetical protein